LPRDSSLTLIPLLILIIAMVGGCISVSPGNSGPPSLSAGAAIMLSPTPGYSGAGPAGVFITSPEFDGGISAGNVSVTVQVSNFSLVNGTGRPFAPSEGHLLYFMDVTPPTKPGSPALTLPGTFESSVHTLYTWRNVSPGTHTFSVELVSSDNTPLIPAVIDSVDITAVAYDQLASVR